MLWEERKDNPVDRNGCGKDSLGARGHEVVGAKIGIGTHKYSTMDVFAPLESGRRLLIVDD